MAEGWDFQKLYADLVENMQQLEIRRKMQEHKEPEKFADSQNCTHIAFDERELPDDRELEIFSDDLFNYLLFRRLNVTDYRSRLQRTPDDPISNFHPHIGMSVLCTTYKTQKHIFMEILQNKLEIENLDNIARYFTHKAFLLHSSVQYNVFYQLLLLAAITLELSAFFYLRGHKNAMHYGVRLYFAAFRYIYKQDFYASGGWKAWKDSVVKDVSFYVEKLLKGQDQTTEAITVSRWLSRFDRWIAMFSFDDLKACSQIESTSASNESDNVQDATHISTYDLENLPNYATTRTKEEALKCLSSKDCPVGIRFRHKSPYLMLELIEIIARQKDSTPEDLLRILENDTYVKELTRYCIFFTIMTNLRSSKVKMRNIDIFQCVKLILQGNAVLATYCFYIVIGVFQELDETKSFQQQDTEGKALHKTSEIHNPQETKNSDRESVKSSPPVKESSFSLYEKHKNLFDSFHQKIKSNGQHLTSSAAIISEILSNKANAEILSTSNIFLALMKTTVDWPGNRWEDEWILSIMTLLINNSQTKDVLMDRTTVDVAQNKYLANEVPSINVNPQLIKSVPSSCPKTPQSSLPSTSKLENIEIEPVCTDDSTKSHQNMLPVNECRECFNRVNEKLRLVQYDMTG